MVQHKNNKLSVVACYNLNILLQYKMNWNRENFVMHAKKVLSHLINFFCRL